jgi:hypothetical protein
LKLLELSNETTIEHFTIPGDYLNVHKKTQETLWNGFKNTQNTRRLVKNGTVPCQ